MITAQEHKDLAIEIVKEVVNTGKLLALKDIAKDKDIEGKVDYDALISILFHPRKLRTVEEIEELSVVDKKDDTPETIEASDVDEGLDNDTSD